MAFHKGHQHERAFANRLPLRLKQERNDRIRTCEVFREFPRSPRSPSSFPNQMLRPINRSGTFLQMGKPNVGVQPTGQRSWLGSSAMTGWAEFHLGAKSGGKPFSQGTLLKLMLSSAIASSPVSQVPCASTVKDCPLTSGTCSEIDMKSLRNRRSVGTICVRKTSPLKAGESGAHKEKRRRPSGNWQRATE